jgi:hypothetical protein
MRPVVGGTTGRRAIYTSVTVRYGLLRSVIVPLRSVKSRLTRSIARSDLVNYTTTGSDPAKRTCEGGGGGGGGGRSRSSRGGGGACKVPVRLVTVRKRAVNSKRVLTEGAAGTFAAVMAVGAASTKETRHRHTHCPRTRPCLAVSALDSIYLTNNLAKQSLQIGGSGGVQCAAGPQDRGAGRGQQRQRCHGAGWAGGEGRQGGGGGGGRQASSKICCNGSSNSSSSSSSSSRRRHSTDYKYIHRPIAGRGRPRG